MARKRLISPEAPHDEAVASVSIPARLVWAYLPCHADREGRLKDSPFKLKLAMLPLDALDMDGLLGELAEQGLIFRYEVDGSRYIQIRSFDKHQDPHPREAESMIPACSDDRRTKVSLRQTLAGPGQTKAVASPSVIDPVPVPDPVSNNSSSYSAKPSKSAVAEDSSEVVISLPMTGQNFFNITQKRTDTYRELYPAVDVLLQLKRLRQWLLDNPSQVNASETGIKRRITSWLKREQDRPAQPGQFVERRQVPRIPQPNAQIAATDKLLKDHRTCETHKADPSVKRTDPVHWCRICQGPQVVYSANPQPGAPGVVLAALMARSTST